MRHLFTFLLVLFAGFAQAAPGNPFETKPDFLPVGKAFTFTSERLESGETQLYWQIADGYYLYKQRMKFDGLAEKPALPQGEAHSDEFFGDQEVYRQGLEVKIPAGTTGQVKLGWQGCADAGLCYPPQSITVDLGGNPAVAATAEAQDQSLASGLQQRSLGWSLLVFFGLGLLLAFTPCSLPMLPILAGMIVGSGATPRRGFALASSYVICMALVYAAMGVIVAAPTAGSCGAMPGAVLGVADSLGLSDEETNKALLIAGLIGVFIAAHSTFAAEVGGCQAECGSGATMAAAAIVHLAGGNLNQSISAASMALQSSLGMICDPIGNRVEAPCLNRNVMAASNALSCANMALADYDHLIPLDQVIETMYEVGKSIPNTLRCTNLGGLSITKAAKEIELKLGQKSFYKSC